MKFPVLPVAVYPSQLEEFKLRAGELAKSISIQTSTKPLSAFKRNDYLAISLGYKGYSDLVYSSQFRATGDKNAPFSIFHSDILKERVIKVFVSKISELTEDVMRNVCGIRIVCSRCNYERAFHIHKDDLGMSCLDEAKNPNVLAKDARSTFSVETSKSDIFANCTQAVREHRAILSERKISEEVLNTKPIIRKNGKIANTINFFDIEPQSELRDTLNDFTERFVKEAQERSDWDYYEIFTTKPADLVLADIPIKRMCMITDYGAIRMSKKDEIEKKKP
ncbi:MAG: hypothetical protein HAW67_02090 [Endozoicomonadaceae bacterium]|nr:hypothetical protein [Endozoicomonadaceae bacterium]